MSVVERGIGYADIDALQFGLLTGDDIERLNIPEIKEYVPKRNPLENYSINCTSNGPSNANALCRTCGNDFEHCQGHLSKITLYAPVLHVDYLQLLLKILPTICIRCMRVLAPTCLLKKLNQSRVPSSKDAFRKCINDVFKLCSRFNRVCWFPNDDGTMKDAKDKEVKQTKKCKKKQSQEEEEEEEYEADEKENEKTWSKKRKKQQKKCKKTKVGKQEQETQEEEEAEESIEAKNEEPHLLSMEEAQKRGYCGATQPDLWMLYERFMIRPAWYLKNEHEWGDLPKITPQKIYGMLKYVEKEIIRLYGFDPQHSPLHGMMISIVIVPPPLTRLPRGGFKPEDDLTTLLNQIFKLNVKLKERAPPCLNLTMGLVIPPDMTEIPTTPLTLKKRATMTIVQGPMSEKIMRKTVSVISKELEDYFMVQRELAVYIDSKYNVSLNTEYPRNLVCLHKRFASKTNTHGLVREAILGKPSNFCARGVASCDTNQDIDQLGVPLRVAMHVTIPEKVTPYNFHAMLLLAINGKTNYPGCNFIQHEGHDYSPDANRNGLPLASILHRHLQNDDPIIANRAPSLHRWAIMGYRVVVHDRSTMRSPLAVCKVLNLDFDGDELTINVPQSVEQIAEVLELLRVTKNLICDNELVIGCVQHSAIGAERATNEDYGPLIFSAFDLQQILVQGNNDLCRKRFERKWTRFNNRNELTGRQMLQLILPTYDGTYILNKKSLNQCIRDTIHHMSEMEIAAGLIGFLTRILERISCQSGTSILLDDILFQTPASVEEKANAILEQAHYFSMQQSKLELSSNTFTINIANDNCDSMPPSYLSIIGLTEKDIGVRCVHNNEEKQKSHSTTSNVEDEIELEDDLCETLARYRDVVGKPLLEFLKNKPGRSSGIHTIVSSGAKGDVTAIVQNLKVVGQQNTGYSTRYKDSSTSHYYRDDCAKNGFVRHALIDSLTPTEYFFLLRTGRDGLINTSCKTGDIGYVYRKIWKNLEDLRIAYGSTVRNAKEQIILFSYGFDTTFLRPQKLETVWLNIAECVEQFATNNDASSICEVEHLLLLRERVLLGESPSVVVLFPFHFDGKCSSVYCINHPKYNFNNDDSDDDNNEQQHGCKKKAHRCIPANLNAVRNRVCKMWVTMVTNHMIPATQAHELCFFEQLSTRKLRDRGFLSCGQIIDVYLTHVERMFVSNMCVLGDACGMKTSQDTTQPGTQAGLSLFRIAGEKTTVLQGTARFTEIVNLPKTMHQPMMYIYLDREIENTFDPMSLVELRLMYIVTHFDDKLMFPNWQTYKKLLPSTHRLADESWTEEKAQEHLVHLTMYLDKNAMHRRQLSPRIVAQYLGYVRVLLYDLENVSLTYARLEDDNWWVTISIPTSSSIWQAVAPETDMPKVEKSSLLMYTLKTDKMLLAGYEGIRDFKVVDKKHLEADAENDGKLIEITRKCIVTQGSNLQDICSLPGVDLRYTYSTNIHQMFRVFGIDAAQHAIYEGLLEALDITPGHPASQHAKIIAATMCFSGAPLPLTYAGMSSRDPESWLQRALFERSLEAFRGASIVGHYNNFRGVSPRIMVGAPIPIGTGGDFSAIPTDAKQREELTTTTRDEQRAVKRWFDTNVVPKGEFYCPKPCIDEFLNSLKSKEGEFVRFQFFAVVAKEPRSSKKRPLLHNNKPHFYMSQDKGHVPFVPSSPKIKPQNTRGHLQDDFIPSSP